MKLGIMQPYFLPYIGYFQLIAAVDEFILYDNIKYTKKGWINRNRLLQHGKDAIFTLPLKSDSDFMYVKQRELSPEFNRRKLLNQFSNAYMRAPYFETAFPLLERIVQNEDSNLFAYLHDSITELCKFLSINTKITISSDIAIDHTLRGQDKVLTLCAATGASQYINSIGGVELYSKDVFRSLGIELSFIKSYPYLYKQYDNEFVPWLSIIDVLMFNQTDAVRECISTNFELV